MKPGPLAVKCVQMHEACPTNSKGICMPYHCAVDPPGVWTIGHGHKIRANEHWMLKGINRFHADVLFLADFDSHTNNLDSVAQVPLNQGQSDGLASFQYNLGPLILLTGGTGGGVTTLLKRLRAKNYYAAAIQMTLFCHSAGEYQDGLFYRRVVEAYLFLTGKLIPKISVSLTCIARMKEIEVIVGTAIAKPMWGMYNSNHGGK